MTGRELAAVLLLMIPGCAPVPEHVFRCPDGAELGAAFRDDSVHLRLETGDVTLPLARSASGARYANDTLVFWEHQGAVRVEHRGLPLHVDCRPTDG